MPYPGGSPPHPSYPAAHAVTGAAGVKGMKLGEAVALSILRDVATLYHEEFPGFTLTRFDGTPITICPEC